jgi:hypothetical protein
VTEGKWRTVGVSLAPNELGRLDDLAGKLDVSRNALMRFFINHGMRQHAEGDLQIPTENADTPGKTINL